MLEWKKSYKYKSVNCAHCTREDAVFRCFFFLFQNRISLSLSLCTLHSSSSIEPTLRSVRLDLVYEVFVLEVHTNRCQKILYAHTHTSLFWLLVLCVRMCVFVPVFYSLSLIQPFQCSTNLTNRFLPFFGVTNCWHSQFSSSSSFVFFFIFVSKRNWTLKLTTSNGAVFSMPRCRYRTHSFLYF